MSVLGYCAFSIWLHFFSCKNFKNSLCILETSPWLYMLFTDIFSHCILSIFMFFCRAKVLPFSEVHINNFAFMCHVFSIMYVF